MFLCNPLIFFTFTNSSQQISLILMCCMPKGLN